MIKLGHKFLAGTIGIILVLGLSLVILIRSTVTDKLLIEIQGKGIYMSKHLAKLSANPLLTENIIYLQIMINDYISESDVEYIFIRDQYGRIITHTFKEGFPIELKDFNLSEGGQEYSMRPFVSDGTTMYDIAVPIMKGELGSAHVGISESFIRGSVDDIVRLILIIVACVLILGSAAAIIFARRLTKPLSKLIETSEEIGSGNLDKKVPVMTDDEIGELAVTFNKMIDTLKETTVSRNYLVEAEKKARTERDRAQNYLDIAGVMLVAIGADQKVTLINKRGCEILGYQETEIIGSNWFDRYVPERQQQETKDVFSRLIKGETEGVGQYKNAVSTKSGPERIIEWRNTPLRDEKGHICGTLSSGEDVTERVHAERELYQHQQELVSNHEELNKTFKHVEIVKKEWECTMDCVGDMIILTDETGAIKRTNKSVREFTGKSYRELIGLSWEDLIIDSELEATTLYVGSTELFHSPTGKWFDLNAYPFEDPELNLSGNVITIHESTETKLIAEQLEKRTVEIEEHRNNLKKALDDFSGMMENVIQDKNLDIKFENPYMIKCYEEKNCGKTDCPCYGQEATRCWKVAGTYCGGNIQGAFAQKYGHCNQCSVFKIATADPIYQIGEHFNNMMHVLRVNNKNLADAYAELKATQSKILQQEKMASVGQLAAGVAHEINNPMGFISSNLGTLGKYIDKLTTFINAQDEIITSPGSSGTSEELNALRKKLKVDYVIDDIGQLINESLDGADRVKKIVQNLKTFSRVDEAEYKHVDINECIESTLNIVWNELKYKATVTKEYGTLPHTKCYPQQLNQVFLNLLVNAAQAIEKQGEIKIKTWNGDGTVNVSISDSGCGIPDDKVQRIFEPFYTTKPVGKGTGLGLSITYDIIKKHNGDIKVESLVGSGTVFTVKIPVVVEE